MIRFGLALLIAALVLLALVLTMGCVSMRASRDLVEVTAVGQVSIATGCGADIATASDYHSVTAGSSSTSPCVAVKGGPISSTLGNVLSGIGGILAGLLLAP